LKKEEEVVASEYNKGESLFCFGNAFDFISIFNYEERERERDREKKEYNYLIDYLLYTELLSCFIFVSFA